MNLIVQESGKIFLNKQDVAKFFHSVTAYKDNNGDNRLELVFKDDLSCVICCSQLFNKEDNGKWAFNYQLIYEDSLAQDFLFNESDIKILVRI
jgi:hypothetical protein